MLPILCMGGLRNMLLVNENVSFLGNMVIAYIIACILMLLSSSTYTAWAKCCLFQEQQVSSNMFPGVLIACKSDNDKQEHIVFLE